MSKDDDKRALDLARAKFDNDLQTFNNLLEVKVTEAKEKVHQISNTLNLKRHFDRHFWLTTAALVGVGMLIARPSQATRVILSSGQMNQLVKATEKHAMQSAARPSTTHSLTDGILALGSMLNSSVVTTLAGIAFGLARDKFAKRDLEPENQDDYIVH